MIIRGSCDERLVIEAREWGPRGTPEDGDLKLSIAVVVGGYAVTEQCWIVGEDWNKFLLELRQLEERRCGHADLLGASPDRPRIRFAVDHAARPMSVSGTIARCGTDGFSLKLEFGFHFDAGMLASVVRELGTFTR